MPNANIFIALNHTHTEEVDFMDDLRKKMFAPALVAVISAMFLYFLLFTSFSIGKVLNIAVKCVDAPGNSFPCYGVYDIFAILLFLVVFIVSVVILFIHSNTARKVFKRRK